MSTSDRKHRRHRSRSRSKIRIHTRRLALWLGLPVLVLVLAGAGVRWWLLQDPETATFLESGLDQESLLADIPANTWVKVHQPWWLDWRRQAHAGAAMDSLRGRLLLFGADTPGGDNQVHIFDPDARHWHAPLPMQGNKTYRADAQGRAIAGDTKQPAPWAFPTFDAITYDSRHDTLVVMGRPDPNSAGHAIPGLREYPVWFLHLRDNIWQPHNNRGNLPPPLSGGALAYDSKRDTLVAYQKGVWEMGPERGTWRLATTEFHHQSNYSMEYDGKHGQFAVFGDQGGRNVVWLYQPGATPGEAGVWSQHTPAGAAPPPGKGFPVAFDDESGLFLLAVDSPHAAGQRADHADTYVYDPEADRYHRLPLGRLPPLGTNYTMAYSPRDKVFLLVTGSAKAPPVIWALRINPELLDVMAMTRQKSG